MVAAWVYKAVVVAVVVVGMVWVVEVTEAVEIREETWGPERLVGVWVETVEGVWALAAAGGRA